jgi:hypothetical protein
VIFILLGGMRVPRSRVFQIARGQGAGCRGRRIVPGAIETPDTMLTEDSDSVRLHEFVSSRRGEGSSNDREVAARNRLVVDLSQLLGRGCRREKPVGLSNR